MLFQFITFHLEMFHYIFILLIHFLYFIVHLVFTTLFFFFNAYYLPSSMVNTLNV